MALKISLKFDPKNVHKNTTFLQNLLVNNCIKWVENKLYFYDRDLKNKNGKLTHPLISGIEDSFLGIWNHKSPETSPNPIVWIQLSFDNILKRASMKFLSERTFNWVQKDVGHFLSSFRSTSLLKVELAASDQEDLPESSSSLDSELEVKRKLINGGIELKFI